MQSKKSNPSGRTRRDLLGLCLQGLVVLRDGQLDQGLIEAHLQLIAALHHHAKQAVLLQVLNELLLVADAR